MILCSVEVTGALRGRDRSTSTWEHMELHKSLENQSEDAQCREESGHSGGGETTILVRVPLKRHGGEDDCNLSH